MYSRNAVKFPCTFKKSKKGFMGKPFCRTYYVFCLIVNRITVGIKQYAIIVQVKYFVIVVIEQVVIKRKIIADAAAAFFYGLHIVGVAFIPSAVNAKVLIVKTAARIFLVGVLSNSS